MVDKIRINFISLSLFLPCILSSAAPTPAPWPVQFHSILFINGSDGLLQVTDLWYDWPNGRNFNIIQHQLGKKLYDLEWNNGTSFYYTLDANKECKTVRFPVGILRPNFLDGANYTGQERRDGFLCNVWEKADFITYYEDVESKRPVSWTFFSGMRAHVMTFEVGKVLDDPNWQAPVYCFEKAKYKSRSCGVAINSNPKCRAQIHQVIAQAITSGLFFLLPLPFSLYTLLCSPHTALILLLRWRQISTHFPVFLKLVDFGRSLRRLFMLNSRSWGFWMMCMCTTRFVACKVGPVTLPVPKGCLKEVRLEMS